MAMVKKIYMKEMEFRAGFVSIVGKPNVGKSTLMNRLIGEKLSIVTPKPQTTRKNIKGILNNADSQIIFLDTPGFLKPRYELQEKMLNYINDSIKGADVIMFITDATDFGSEYDEAVIEMLKKSKKPVLCIINKTDICDDDKIEIIKEQLKDKFEKYVFISALKGDNFKEIIDYITELLPKSPPLYNQDDISDLPLRFFAQEIIREKIFLFLEQEIPYSSTVVVEKWIEYDNRDVIKANIWLERDTQKTILIGKNGKMIDKIRVQAENDIEKLTGKKAVVNLWVKVKHDWRKKYGALHEFGYL
jgi:GTP-binding protein Era